MPNLTPEQLRTALYRLAADESENSFGDAVTQVVVHGDQRFAPLAVVKAALGDEIASLDEHAAVELLQSAGAEIENKDDSFPGFKRFFLPTLAALADGEPRTKKQVEPLVAKQLKLSPALCSSVTKKNGELRLRNKVHFSCVYLNAAGLIKSISRGIYTITSSGQELLMKGLSEIDQNYLEENYPGFKKFQRGTAEDESEDITPAIWILGSGDGGGMKTSFLSGNYIGVDFGIRVNLAAATPEEVNKAFQRHGEDTRSENQRACEDFCQELEVGDYVLLKSGRSLIVAYGRIDGNYEFKADAVSYPHQRKVIWLRTDEFTIPRDTGMLPLKTLTEAKPSNPAIKAALDHFRAGDIRVVKPVWLALPPSPHPDLAAGRLTFSWSGDNPPEKPISPKKTMRPRFHFGQMGIPIGSVLRFTEGDVQIEVIGERKVRYENRERSLTEITRTLKQLDRNVQPVRYWTFQGKNLLDIYNATYPRKATEDGASEDWWQNFLYGMQLGDLVLARTEAAQTYRIGEVASAVQHDPTQASGQYWREIKWLDRTVTSAELAELEEDPVEPLDDENLPETVRTQLFPAKPTGKPYQLMTSKPTNLILFGPPGTGKTYVTAQHAVALCQGRPLEELSKESNRDQLMVDYRRLCESGNIAFVTFHQTYDYTDFVEGLRPQVTPDKRMTYELVPGVLRRLSALATDTQRKGEQFVLIIDEINRGNVSKILGELITLIETDKRLGAKNELRVTLPISGETFGLPRNLHLIGTMNTADRSIALIDTALRRRFDFIPMDPQPAVLESANYSGEVRPGEFLTALNRKLAEVFRDREHAIGHAWFMFDGDKPRSQEQVLIAFKDKVVPTLTEWLWDSPEKLQEILGSEVVDEFGKVDPSKITGKCLKDILGNPAKSPPLS